MKKQIMANQSGRAAEVRAEMPGENHTAHRKVVYSHKPADHHHGRVNKYSIGVNHEPGLFH